MKSTVLLCLLLLVLGLAARGHVRRSTAPPVMPQPGTFCAHADPVQGLIAYPCKLTSTERLDPLIADALGHPPCWWTAQAAVLDRRIEGVSARVADALVSLRNTGERASPERVTALPRVGDALASRVADAVSIKCGPLGRHKASSGERFDRSSGGSTSPSSR